MNPSSGPRNGVSHPLLVILLLGLDELVSDILPLAASVVAIPDLVHGVVEAYLPGETGGEDGREHQVVRLEEGAVEPAGDGHLG